MNNRTPAQVFAPGEFLLEELEERGWTQISLAKITGRHVSTINGIIKGKLALTPEIASEFASALGTSPQFWLNLENAYQLSKVSVEGETIKQRAKLFETAPIREMEKRGWIRVRESIKDTENEL
ncbi:MAG TPA: HigA family addiction module antitoxin, partial [Verrucomicrobiae bacterium]